MVWIIPSGDVFEILVELVIIWMCVFLAFRFLQGTRGAGVIIGLVILLIPLLLLQTLADLTEGFGQLASFSKAVRDVLILLVIIIFQPELRQAAIKITQSDFLALFRTDGMCRKSANRSD